MLKNNKKEENKTRKYKVFGYIDEAVAFWNTKSHKL